jgi:uncharacterized LabA/DUF88 family protein
MSKGLGRGYFFTLLMATGTQSRLAVAFIDGQNLFHAAREAFGYNHPNYDVQALAGRICLDQGWALKQVRFYTGIPDPWDDAFWHGFWAAKLSVMGRQGVLIFSRSLRYRKRTVRLPDGREHTFLAGEEKGIDVRIALDAIRLAHRREYDVGLILSQDQDLSEVADEIREITKEQDRWIKLACAFPFSTTTRNRRGIDKTDWIRISRHLRRVPGSQGLSAEGKRRKLRGVKAPSPCWETTWSCRDWICGSVWVWKKRRAKSLRSSGCGT